MNSSLFSPRLPPLHPSPQTRTTMSTNFLLGFAILMGGLVLYNYHGACAVAQGRGWGCVAAETSERWCRVEVQGHAASIC